jgi:hypothetical protein
MRITTPTIVFAGTLLAAGPVRAQTYDPNYPVCLQVFGRVGYIDCRYTSLPQCNMSASGRPATCLVNPYYAGASLDRPPVARHHRQHYRAY